MASAFQTSSLELSVGCPFQPGGETILIVLTIDRLIGLGVSLSLGHHLILHLLMATVIM